MEYYITQNWDLYSDCREKVEASIVRPLFSHRSYKGRVTLPAMLINKHGRGNPASTSLPPQQNTPYPTVGIRGAAYAVVYPRERSSIATLGPLCSYDGTCWQSSSVTLTSMCSAICSSVSRSIMPQMFTKMFSSGSYSSR